MCVMDTMPAGRQVHIGPEMHSPTLRASQCWHGTDNGACENKTLIKV